MLVKDSFGMLSLQLLLLIKGAGSMFIIDVTEGLLCCPLCILDSTPDTGHFLEEYISIFNVLVLPELLSFLDGVHNI